MSSLRFRVRFNLTCLIIHSVCISTSLFIKYYSPCSNSFCCNGNCSCLICWAKLKFQITRTLIFISFNNSTNNVLKNLDNKNLIRSILTDLTVVVPKPKKIPPYKIYVYVFIFMDTFSILTIQFIFC